MSPERAGQVLQLPLPWTAETIKKAYRRRARVLHPDVSGGNKAAFEEAAEARAVLDAHLKRQADPAFEDFGEEFSGVPPWVQAAAAAHRREEAEKLRQKAAVYGAAMAAAVVPREKMSVSEMVDEMWEELPALRKDHVFLALLVTALYVIRALWRAVRLFWPALRPLSQVGFRILLLYWVVRFFSS